MLNACVMVLRELSGMVLFVELHLFSMVVQVTSDGAGHNVLVSKTVALESF